MSSPFSYGGIVYGADFLNRKADIDRIAYNIRSMNSSILISPRRWGKSSLVRQVALTFTEDDDFVFCFLDAFPLKSEEEFLEQFAKTVLKAFSSKLEEVLAAAKEFLTGILPTLSFSVDPNSEVALKFAISDKKSAEEILMLGEKLAAKHNKKLVVCIDEFQNIEHFAHPLDFQKLLRSYWQNQPNVCFVIYGSKRHMMHEMFAKRSYPFYKFGDLITLEKISTAEWVPYICQKFAQNGKSISPELAADLVESVSRHTQYVQHLAHLAFYFTPDGEAMTAAELEQSIQTLIKDNQPLFQAEFEQLSKQQVAFLRMLMGGVTSGFTKSENLKKYDLNSSAAVSKILAALEKKDIIDRYGTEVNFTDPVFRLWLNRILK
jgi:AAA+ ATPase superfamily predicted ATPase